MVTVVLLNRTYPAVCRLCPNDCDLSAVATAAVGDDDDGDDILSYLHRL